MSEIKLNDFFNTTQAINDNHKFYIIRNGALKAQNRIASFFTFKSTFQKSTSMFLDLYQKEYGQEMTDSVRKYLSEAKTSNVLTSKNLQHIQSITQKEAVISLTDDTKIESYLYKLATENALSIEKNDLACARKLLTDYINYTTASTSSTTCDQPKTHFRRYETIAVRYLASIATPSAKRDLLTMTVPQREKYTKLFENFGYCFDPYITEKLHDSLKEILSPNTDKPFIDLSPEEAWKQVFGVHGNYTHDCPDTSRAAMKDTTSSKIEHLEKVIIKDKLQDFSITDKALNKAFTSIRELQTFGLPFEEAITYFKTGQTTSHRPLAQYANDRQPSTCFDTSRTLEETQALLRNDTTEMTHGYEDKTYDHTQYNTLTTSITIHHDATNLSPTATHKAINYKITHRSNPTSDFPTGWRVYKDNQRLDTPTPAEHTPSDTLPKNITATINDTLTTALHDACSVHGKLNEQQFKYTLLAVSHEGQAPLVAFASSHGIKLDSHTAAVIDIQSDTETHDLIITYKNPPNCPLKFEYTYWVPSDTQKAPSLTSFTIERDPRIKPPTTDELTTPNQKKLQDWQTTFMENDNVESEQAMINILLSK